MEFFSLNPGERAVVPLQWNLMRASSVSVCSTHPEAPVGLTVLPGICDSKEFASVIVENESALPVTVSDKDFIAIALEEGDAPLLDEC